MIDEELARLVARDFAGHLERRAADLDGPVYAVALAAEDEYGQYLATMNTEKTHRPSAGPPEDGNPSSSRWNSGNWDVWADDFVSAETRQALAPLSTILTTSDDEEESERASWHWVEIAFRAVELARPLTVLPVTTPDAIAYVSFHDVGTVDAFAAMQRNVPGEQFHALFPEWRQAAAAMREIQADETRMQHLRDVLAAARLTGFTEEATRMPAYAALEASELNTLLRSVGLSWAHLVIDEAQVQLALDIADRS